MLALVRGRVLTEQRAGFCEGGGQGDIDLRLAEGRLPASLGENGHGLAAREMPGADQNALRGESAARNRRRRQPAPEYMYPACGTTQPRAAIFSFPLWGIRMKYL